MANLLPPAKINLVKFLPSSSALVPKSIEKSSEIISGNNLIVIHTRTIEVKKLLQTSLLLKKEENQKKRIKAEETESEKREKELETKPDAQEGGKYEFPSLPKLGFLDRIKRFFINILLGYVAVKLVPYVDKLPGIVGAIGTGIDFATDMFIGLFDGLSTFVQKGYEAYDFSRNLIKNFGGDSTLKLFDGFSDALGNIITGAIAAAFAFADMGGGDSKDTTGRGGKPGRPGRQPLYNNRGFRDNQGFTLQGERALNPSRGKSFANAHRDIMKRYFQRFGRDKFIQRFGEEGLEALPKGMSRSGIAKLGRRAFVGVLGKGGAKAVLGTVRPFLKRIPLPVIGALIDFGLSVALGEDPGRAAFKAIGAGLLGAVGAAAGSIVPIAGTFLGGLVGGALGDAAGGALYDVFFGKKKPSPQKVSKQAEGGPAPTTRGGKLVGSPTRRTPPKKTKRSIKVQPTKLKPGASVGGDKKIQTVFPEASSQEQGKTVNPLGYMKTSYDKFSATPGFGGLFAIVLKAQLGEKPTDLDYQNASEGLTGWMQRTFSTEIMRTGAAYAEGGLVDVGMFGDPGNMKDMIAKSIQNSVTPKVENAINELMKQLTLKEIDRDEDEEKKQPSPGVGGTAGQYTPEGIQGDIYKYLISKGMSDYQALGIMANIHRESGFRVDARQPDGPGIGLFQYSSAGRKDAFLKAVPDWEMNWKKQIDYALQEDAAPQYLKMKFSSAQEAADWWMKKWERPAEYIQNVKGPQIHSKYLASIEKYKTKKGYDLPTSADLSVGGKGYGAEGSKIAGELGRFIKSKLRQGSDFSQVHRHPEHPPYSLTSGHSRGSLHYQGRAIDIGSHAHEQGKILKVIAEFNKMKGLKPTQLLHAGNEPRGHSDHVHVAYAKGGRVKKPMKAIIGERGEEFIFDHDTTKGLDILAPGLLEQLNYAKTKPQLASILQSYAGYEDGSEEVVQVVVPEPQVVPMMMPIPMDSGMVSGVSGGSNDGSYDFLYQGH